MTISITIKPDLRSLEKDLNKIKKEIKKEVIDTGLDSELRKFVVKLRADLRSFINNTVTSTITTKTIKAQQNVEKVSVKKSDEEMLKYITGVDLNKFRLTRDFSSADENLVMHFDYSSKTGRRIENKGLPDSEKSIANPMSSGVNYRLKADNYSDFNVQYSRAKDFFNTAVFAIQDGSGSMQYYTNPGVDLSPYVKVVCSTEIGDTDKSRERFDTNITRRGFVDWTLKREGLDVVKSNFINLTSIINSIKNGDIEEATFALGVVKDSNNNKMVSNLSEKLSDLAAEETVSESVKPTKMEIARTDRREAPSYLRLIRLINTLKIKKNTGKVVNVYTLVSENLKGADKESLNILEDIRLFIRTEAKSNKDRWLKVLQKKEKEILKRFKQ